MASLGQRMVGAMKADVATFEEVERDPSAMGQAVAVIAIAGVAALIGNIFRAGIGGGIAALLFSLLGYAVWALMVTFIGTKLMPEPATKADFPETFRTVAFAASPGIFNVIAIIPLLGPLLSFLISLWSFVIMIVAVRTVLDYTSTVRAVIVCLIGFCIYWFIVAVLGIMMAGSAMVFG
jgi:hypothetical protein